MNIFERFYARDDIRNIFDEKSIVENWLMFEALLAEIQGDLKIIPFEAASEIKRKASLDYVNFERIVELYAKTRHAGLATISALREVCEKDAGEWVHYGSSAPEMWENTLAYRLGQVMDIFERDLAEIKTSLNQLADRHRHTIMVERSLGKQALPTTFGFVTAVWSDAISKNISRFKEARKRILAGFLKGVVGTYASHYQIAGEKCLELEKRVLDRLGLFPNDISFNRHLDRLTEFLSLLLVLAQTFEKVFNDILFQQRDEIGELGEPYENGMPSVSSTLPQKKNPVMCLSILAKCKKIRSNTAAFADTQVMQSHDTLAFGMENLIIPESCVLAGDVLHIAKYVLQNLLVFPEAMRKNLELSGGLVMTESLVMGVSKKTGKKQIAHDIVQKAIFEALDEGMPFTDYVVGYPEILKYLKREEIESLLLPENYLGLIDMCINKVIAN